MTADAKQIQKFNRNELVFGYMSYKYSNKHEEGTKYELLCFLTMC